MDIVLNDTVNRLIVVGDPFDKEVLQQERQRLEELLKNNGFYKFSKEFIFFEAKELGEKNLVDLLLIVKEDVAGIPDPVTKVRKHYPYKIKNTLVFPNYSSYSEKSG